MEDILLGPSYIKRLSIKDFVLVKEQTVHFDPGFNVITGETGAGKSVMIEALSQLLGRTYMGDCIRQSAEMAILEGVLHLSPNGVKRIKSLFRQHDVPGRALHNINSDLGGDLVIKREIYRAESGLRSRCFIEDIPTSVRVLRAIADLFFDINGQHSVMELSDSQKQMKLIDKISGLFDLRQEIADCFKRMAQLKKMLSATSEFEDQNVLEEAKRLCEEVHDSRLAPGEERNLRYTLQVLETHTSSVESASMISDGLDGQGRSEGLSRALNELSSQIKAIVRQEQHNSELSDGEDDEEEVECDSGISCALHCLDEALEHIDKATDEIEKASECVSDFASILEFDPIDQADIRQRLKYIEKLLKEFECTSSEELLDLSMETQSRLDNHRETCDKKADWESDLASVEEEYIRKSVELSRARREVAVKIRSAVEECLEDLAMQDSRFDVRVNWESSEDGVFVPSEVAFVAGENGDGRYTASANGLDSVEFLLAPGPDDPLKPLSAVASGGESARIMLAFKAVPTLIWSEEEGKALDAEGFGSVLVLDELDTGVGCRLGRNVGRLLNGICTSGGGARNQVICISHLPQVAAFASKHIKAIKNRGAEGHMSIEFVVLDTEKDRTEEINAMMGSGGENLAYDLLNEAARVKSSNEIS